MVIFAMGTLLTPCKDSEGTAHVAYSIITQYTNVCSIVLSKGYNFLSDERHGFRTALPLRGLYVIKGANSRLSSVQAIYLRIATAGCL